MCLYVTIRYLSHIKKLMFQMSYHKMLFLSLMITKCIDKRKNINKEIIVSHIYINIELYRHNYLIIYNIIRLISMHKQKIIAIEQKVHVVL